MLIVLLLVGQVGTLSIVLACNRLGTHDKVSALYEGKFLALLELSHQQVKVAGHFCKAHMLLVLGRWRGG